MTGIKTITKNGITKSVTIDIHKCDPSIVEYLQNSGVKIITEKVDKYIVNKIKKSIMQLESGNAQTFSDANSLWDSL